MATYHYESRSPDSRSEQLSGVSVKRKIDRAGRVLIPAKFRKALTVTTGSEVMLMLNEGVLEVRSIDNAIRDAQSLVRRHVPAGSSLVKELISERKQESALE